MLTRQGRGALIGGQDLDERRVERQLAAVDEAQRGDRGRHLRDRRDREARPLPDRDAVAAVSQPADVREDRGAVAPRDRVAAELVGPRPLVEPCREVASASRLPVRPSCADRRRRVTRQCEAARERAARLAARWRWTRARLLQPASSHQRRVPFRDASMKTSRQMRVAGRSRGGRGAGRPRAAAAPGRRRTRSSPRRRSRSAAPRRGRTGPARGAARRRRSSPRPGRAGPGPSPGSRRGPRDRPRSAARPGHCHAVVGEVADGLGCGPEVVVVAIVARDPGEPVAARPVAGIRDPDDVGDRAPGREADDPRLARPDPAHRPGLSSTVGM